MERKYTELQLNGIYDALVDYGAPESYRSDFVHAHLNNDCQEYRFQGVFGFGGKFRVSRATVDYYRENWTPALDKLKDEVNGKILDYLHGEDVGKTVRLAPEMDWDCDKFASGKKESVVTEVVRHPIFGCPAYKFEEDDSIVRCTVCEIIEKVKS